MHEANVIETHVASCIGIDCSVLLTFAKENVGFLVVQEPWKIFI